MSVTTNHRTRWTAQEVQDLMELWDPTAVEELAELLGRTVEAVRQRHYEELWGTSVTPVTSKELVEGKSGSSRGGRPAKERPLRETCSTHNVELPATGVCDWC